MASIYTDQHAELHELLTRASSEQGGTLLIPDLQRPYVWTPLQVILLLDSLIRGWPFGTFLTWKVKKDDPVRELARPFWRVVDRTADDDGEKLSKKNPPGSFQMVLDGQQRIQSVLLAVGSDASGFKLYDRDWAAALTEVKPRGRQGVKHWTIGCLCVDLDELLPAFAKTRKTFGLDFARILKWAVTGGKVAQSEFPKPANYQEPLPRTDDPGCKGRFIRFSRLWEAAPAQEGVEQDQAEAIANELLVAHEVADTKLPEATKAVGSLLLNLSRVKRVRITFLELAEHEEKIIPRESYNDAVVNIFTRLNTAGRTLTREDITFAWLKIGWLQEKTGNRSAAECFDQLGDLLADAQLELTTEDLVAGVSFVWAVAHGNGRVLNNKDLLKGDAIRPMAKDVSEHWSTITESLSDASALLAERSLVYGKHYQSLNAVFVVWGWVYASRLWLSQNPQGVLVADAFKKRVAEALTAAIDRWLICSQWAGRWASSLVDTVAGYAERLSACHRAMLPMKDPVAVTDALKKYLDDELAALQEDAIKGVQTMGVSRREQVSAYFTPLWLWHRLDKTRWKMSKIQLRTAKNRKLLHDVDHTVAYALWEAKIEADLPAGYDDQEAALPVVNKLGNCALLEKTFNISKSDKTLQSFIVNVHELETGEVLLTDWATALAIPSSLLDPSPATSSEVADAIDARDATIRAELIEFIKGTKRRVDLEAS